VKKVYRVHMTIKWTRQIFSSNARLEATLGEADEHGRRLRGTSLGFSPDASLLATASQVFFE